MDLAGAVTELVELLGAAGVVATVDVRDLDFPGVLVGMPTVDRNTLGECWASQVPVYVIGPGVGRTDALEAISGLLGDVMAALGARYATPTEWPNPGGGDPLPAYLVTASVQVED